MAWNVPLADVLLSDADIDAVTEVYRSGWLTMGPVTERFEQEFAAYTGSSHALAVANGTAALHMACLAIGLGPGDEVVVPSMTFVASVNAVSYTGASPVFADISGLTQPWLSAEAAEAAITPRTRAIMNVSYGGHPGEVEELKQLAADRDLVLLEDAAHAPGSRAGGRHLGTFGAIGAFSFFSNKNLAIGEGGAVVTDDPELAERLRLLRSHGMTSLTWDRHRGRASEYDVVALGMNYRIDEPRAALASRRLAALDAENEKRRQLDAWYREALRGAEGVASALPARSGAIQSRHIFVIVLDPSIERSAFRAGLADAGIQTSIHYPPAHHFSIYADHEAELPLTDSFGARTVTLPLFGHMTSAQLDHVVEHVLAAVNFANSH